MQPSGFPMKVNVRIYQSPFACHCHSYEEIKCGAEGDDLCHKLSQPSTRWRNWRHKDRQVSKLKTTSFEKY